MNAFGQTVLTWQINFEIGDILLRQNAQLASKLIQHLATRQIGTILDLVRVLYQTSYRREVTHI